MTLIAHDLRRPRLALAALDTFEPSSIDSGLRATIRRFHEAIHTDPDRCGATRGELLVGCNLHRLQRQQSEVPTSDGVGDPSLPDGTATSNTVTPGEMSTRKAKL